MKITYIHHSSFLVELDQVSFLFDYTEGVLPVLPPDKDLVVFVSHRHGDHFSPVIFELKKQYPSVRYVLSDDIWQNRVPEETACVVDFMDPGRVRKLQCGNGITVTAYRSTDEGVAFLVETEGKRIYHAGDLNNWMWEGESKAWNHNMSANYRREIEKLKDIPLEVAFLPLDGRQESWFYLGMDDFLKQVSVKYIFPMHFWGDYSVIQKMKALDCSESYRDRLIVIERENQVFDLEEI